MAEHNMVGKIGESLATHALMNRGFSILDRNIRRPWGEIDIIAQKDTALHFVEVKSVSGKAEDTPFRPEEKMHYKKQQRLARIIATYREEQNLTHTPFFIDLAMVYIRPGRLEGEIRWLWDITLEV